MKKAQKDQIKAGGELARKIYQVFMQDPAWMTHIDKENLLEALTEIINQQEAMYGVLDEECKKRNYNNDDGFDIINASLEDAAKRSKRAKEYADFAYERYKQRCRIFDLKQLRMMFAPKDAILTRMYGENNQVHADFSMYCRDN